MAVESLRSIRDAAFERFRVAHDALPGGPDRPDVEGFLRLARAVEGLRDYKQFPVRACRVVAGVRERTGPDTARTFLRAALMRAVVDTIDGGACEALPPRTRRHQIVQLRRIAFAEQGDPSWLDLGNDLYQKDFGLATVRLYAAAAVLIDQPCGVPRSLVKREGLFSAPGKLATIFRLGGFRPYFEIHAHPSYLDEFHEEGWRECYATCVELYERHPEILGLFGASWFYDPVVEEISPRLRYLRRVPIDGGGRFWLFATDGHFVHDAILRSPTRRALYEQGRYRPRSFLLLWGREAQSRWVREAGLMSSSSVVP